MRERAALILKVVCVCLAAWLAWELVQAGRDANPLASVTMPDVPSLPADTNAPPTVAGKPPGKPGTNAITPGANTNGSAVVGDTNAAPHKRVHSGETNAAAIAAVSASTNGESSTNVSIATNVVRNASTNSGIVAAAVADTNVPVVATTNVPQTNSVPGVSIVSPETNIAGSNIAGVLPTNVASGTNMTIIKMPNGTNLAGGASRTNLTNSGMAKAGARPPNGAAMAAMMGGPAGRKPAALAPEIQARVDRVYESEIFAPIMHPMPMALLGIAGNVAFLRAPSGQTGLVKEGEGLGDIKLLRIGTNRVLVEQDGKKQELMIFSGYGGESLLSKTNESSNETTKN